MFKSIVEPYYGLKFENYVRTQNGVITSDFHASLNDLREIIGI